MPSWKGLINKLTGRGKEPSNAGRDSRTSPKISRTGVEKRDSVAQNARSSAEKRGSGSNDRPTSQGARDRALDQGKNPPSYDSKRLSDQNVERAKVAAAYVQSVLDSRPEGTDRMELLNGLAGSRDLQVRIAVANEMARLTNEANNARHEEKNRIASAPPVDTPPHPSSREASSPVPQSLEQAGQFAEAAWNKLPPRFDTSAEKPERLSLQQAKVSRDENIRNAARQLESDYQIKYYMDQGVKIVAEQNNRLAKPAENSIENSVHGMEAAGHDLRTASGPGQETARVFKPRPKERSQSR